MGKVIIHKLTNEELTQKREREFFNLSEGERFFETLKLIRVSRLFSQQTNNLNRKKIIIKG